MMSSMMPALTISADMVRICAMTSGALTSAPMAFMMPADLPMTPAILDMPAAQRGRGVGGRSARMCGVGWAGGHARASKQQ